MALWTLLIFFVLALCTIAVLGTLVATQRAKADYSQALHFAEQFAELIGKTMPSLSEEQRKQVLKATGHIDDGKLARRMSKMVSSPTWYDKVLAYFRPAYFRYREDRTYDVQRDDLTLDLVTAMKPYIFALSYFDHLRGPKIRHYCAQQPDGVRKVAAWIFDQTRHSEPSLYWDPKPLAHA